MKRRLFLISVFHFILTLGCAGQTDTTEILKDGVKGAVAALSPVEKKEQEEVLRLVAELLKKKMTFREDGSASAAHHLHGAVTHVEWLGFKVSRIDKTSLSAADRANGMTRRYRAAFSCKASRTWDRTGNRWREWGRTGYLWFPSAAVVTERDGKLVAEMSERGTFLPGPGGGAVRAEPGKKGEVELPAGMKRN